MSSCLCVAICSDTLQSVNRWVQKYLSLCDRELVFVCVVSSSLPLPIQVRKHSVSHPANHMLFLFWWDTSESRSYEFKKLQRWSKQQKKSSLFPLFPSTHMFVFALVFNYHLRLVCTCVYLYTVLHSWPAERICAHSNTTHQPVGTVLPGRLLESNAAELFKAQVEAVWEVFRVYGNISWCFGGSPRFGLSQHAAALLAARHRFITQQLALNLTLL